MADRRLSPLRLPFRAVVTAPLRVADHVVRHPSEVVRTATTPARLAIRLVAKAPTPAGVVTEPARVMAKIAMHPARAVELLVRHRERRIVRTGDRLHIELRPAEAADEGERADLDVRTERTVEGISGVRRARIHEPFRRLVVQLDDDADPDVVLAAASEALDELEKRKGLADVPFAERDHPADDAPIARDVMGIGADLVGITVGSALQAVRFRPPPLEIDFAAALNIADQAVPVRRVLERRLGAPFTEVTVGLANSIVQGAVQGPLGPMVDLGRRVLILRELDGRRTAWLARESELYGRTRAERVGLGRPERSVPLPDGPIERYERLALATSVGAGGLTLLWTRRLERAASMVQAGLPKAARLGREGYVREIGRHLASRGTIVVDPSALALLDRIDCIAISHRLLGPGGIDLAGLVTAARRGHVRVIVETGPGERVPAGADGVATGGLAAAIAAAQTEGRVVALATAGRDSGTLVADLSLGLVLPGDGVPWGAHLIGTDDPADVVLLLEAILQARQVTSESVRLAATGAGGAAILALGSVVPARFQRAPSVVSLASALSLVNGLRHAYDVARRPLPVRIDPTPWHALDTAVVLDRLGTTMAGLPSADATGRLDPEPARSPLPVAFVGAVADELVNPLTPVLAGGAALSVMVGSVVDAALVGGVVVANAMVGGFQNVRSQRALDALSSRQPTEVTVIRDGERRQVLHDSLVQGDVIRLLAGQSVPADCRILASSSLEVDEAALTGESVPVAKGPAPIEASVLAERTSMIYKGSWIAAGEATAVVVATGSDTEASRAVLLAGEPPASGVEARLKAWTGRMIPVALLGGGAVMASGVARARPLRETLGAGVSLAVAAVPEGLPPLATVAQLSAARRLSAHNVLVRNARAIEALGRVDVLCADKTGTLTEGRITLRLVSDTVDESEGGDLSPALQDVLATAVRATPLVDDPADLTHPTDQAVARAGLANGAIAAWTHDGELAFEPARGFHAATGRVGARRVLAVKGAPETVLPKCTSWRRSGRKRTLTPHRRTQIDDAVTSLARRGLRVLAVAEGAVDNDHPLAEHEVSDLTFVGLLGLADPVRDTATDAVGLLGHAGVRVLMITGDHPSTAEAIGADLGLSEGHEVMTGERIDATSDEDLPALLAEASVFARATPSHKVRIVRALQRAGHTVAMTGDGANDAPAIRLADVGIALGADATAAARGAADIVVLDERIETIVDAMIEGRGLWGSVRDAVSVLVGGNLGEVAFTVFGSFVTGRSPLNARQLLLVNLLTDAAPALAIAARPPRSVSAEQLLREGPDTSLASALDRAIAVRAVTTTAATTVAWALTGPVIMPRRSSTTALVTTVGTQLVQTVMTSGRDPLVLVAGVGSGAVLLGIVQTPVLSQLFGCTPLDPLALAVAGTSAGSAAVAARAVPRLLAARS